MAAPPALHELEAEVMDRVWSLGEASVREVMDALNAGGGRPRAYTTYMTVMRRLDDKGLLVRRRQGRGDVYTPALPRDEYLSRRARDDVERLVDEYGDLALSHFAARVAGLDPARRRALQRLGQGGGASTT